MDNGIDYSIMNDTVDKICESLLSEPEFWSFDKYYITAPKKLNSIKIYKGYLDECVSVKNSSYGTETSKVFSFEQGEKIKNAYYRALSKIGSNKQKEIINSIINELKSDNEEKDYSCIYCKFLSTILFIIIIILSLIDKQ